MDSISELTDKLECVNAKLESEMKKLDIECIDKFNTLMLEFGIRIPNCIEIGFGENHITLDTNTYNIFFDHTEIKTISHQGKCKKLCLNCDIIFNRIRLLEINNKFKKSLSSILTFYNDGLIIISEIEKKKLSLEHTLKQYINVSI